jgi:hypothetical protein
VELPFAIDRHHAAADVLNGQNGHVISPFGRLRGTGKEGAVAQRQRE